MAIPTDMSVLQGITLSLAVVFFNRMESPITGNAEQTARQVKERFVKNAIAEAQITQPMVSVQPQHVVGLDHRPVIMSIKTPTGAMKPNKQVKLVNKEVIQDSQIPVGSLTEEAVMILSAQLPHLAMFMRFIPQVGHVTKRKTDVKMSV